jgi:hypothetical protein
MQYHHMNTNIRPIETEGIFYLDTPSNINENKEDLVV